MMRDLSLCRVAQRRRAGSNPPTSEFHHAGKQRQGRGAQVVLTGQARRAARGSAGLPSYVANVQIKAQMEQQGAIGTGYSPDGTTATNAPAHDVAMLAPETGLE